MVWILRVLTPTDMRKYGAFFLVPAYKIVYLVLFVAGVLMLEILFRHGHA